MPPRAADDVATIRARLAELAAERAEAQRLAAERERREAEPQGEAPGDSGRAA
jgi:hypothetical protein